MTSERHIEERLRRHPKAGREIARIAQLMHHESPAANVAEAQRLTIRYVQQVYSGNAEEFLRDYERGELNFATIVQHHGRTQLGLAPVSRKKERIYD